MKKKLKQLSIETLVLVAIWESPFIFQGSFSLGNKSDHSKKLLIFRCECDLEDKSILENDDFLPDSYRFTHLYTTQSKIELDAIDEDSELALYLLKFALNATLKKIITQPAQTQIHMDGVALAAIANQMETYLFYRQEKALQDKDIGFSVAIDFMPKEPLGHRAALALLRMAEISFQ